MIESVHRLPRAVLLPLQTLGALNGVRDVLGASTYAVSLNEAGPTHLLVVTDTLPASFAASASIAGGRILYGRPDSRCFAEAHEEFPGPLEEGLAIRLRGLAEPVVVGGTPQPFAESLEVRWAPDVQGLTRPQHPGIPTRLRGDPEPKPVMAVIVPLKERIGVEDTIQSFPEARMNSVAFAGDEEEILLVSTHPAVLQGIPGKAFYRQSLTEGKLIFLPLGFSLEPEFAPVWLSQLLGNGGDLFFWRETFIQSVQSSDLKPLTRRAWYEAFRGTP